MIISIENFIVKALKKMISDHNTIIAYGSLVDLLLIFANTFKAAYTAYISNGILTLNKEIKIFSDIITEIHECCYINSSKVILFIHDKSSLGYISLKSMPLPSLNEISTKIPYKHI